MLPYINLFNQQIPTYSIMILIGYALGLFVVLFRAKLYSFPKDDVLIAYIMAGIGSFFGGKLFYVIQGIPDFLALHQQTGMSFWEYFNAAGLVYYGGFIGCILFILLYTAIFKTSFWPMLDTLIPALPLAQAFGRVGCFMVGCCYGIPCEHGVMLNASPIAPHGIALLPVQLIESACVFLLFIAMILYGKKRRAPGHLFSIYLLCYGTIRFILEFFRYDAIRGSIGAFSTSQWLSIGAVALGIYFAKFYHPKSRSL